MTSELVFTILLEVRRAKREPWQFVRNAPRHFVHVVDGKRQHRWKGCKAATMSFCSLPGL